LFGDYKSNVAPVYILYREGDDKPVASQLDIIDTLPGEKGYNDFRQVFVIEFRAPVSMSLLPLSTAWMAVSELAPQPVAFYAAVFFLVNATYIFLIWELIGSCGFKTLAHGSEDGREATCICNRHITASSLPVQSPISSCASF
jgi:hypothetical protein